MAVYRIRKDSLFLTELPMYGEKRLGIIKENRFLMKKPTQNTIGVMSLPIPVNIALSKNTTKPSVYTMGKKHYESVDWLGNVRVTYTDKKSWQQNKFALNVSSSLDYYPFGSVMEGRKYNLTAYRYAFNTQERVPELNESHYTAKFWEYDSRLGRRWNVDPKPNPSLSEYSVLADNPVWFNDPLGDTLKVSYRGKDLIYRAGKYYNADGTIYRGRGVRKDGTYKGFLGQTAKALENISKGAEGKKLVEELIESTNVFMIKRGDKNSFTATSVIKAGANIPDVQAAIGNTLGSKGSGGIILWNPNLTESGFNTEGTRTRPSYIGLAHEMFHGRDANRGILHFDNDYTNPFTGVKYYSTHLGLRKSEWRSVYYENILRGQLGLPLRTHYGVKETAPGVFAPDGPKLLDESGNPINCPIR